MCTVYTAVLSVCMRDREDGTVLFIRRGDKTEGYDSYVIKEAQITNVVACLHS